MKKRLILLCSIVISVMLLGSVLLIYAIASGNSAAEPTDGAISHTVMVDDEIKVYVGQDNYIQPYLVGSNGTVETARFDFKSDNDMVEITYEGLIKLKGVPSENVFVTVSERNTGASKKVKLIIINDLESVLGIVAPDGNLISGAQNLVVGETYALTVVTEPNGLSVKDNCTVTVKDSAGTAKKVFDIDFDGDKVLLTVVGIGEGRIFIHVVNAEGKAIHDSEMDFVSKMTDSALSDMILAQSGKSLLSYEELSSIEKITVDTTITDIKSLGVLPALKTVFIRSEEPIGFENISDKYFYRVHEDQYLDYILSDSRWSGFTDRLLPYDDENGGVYAVYHSDKNSYPLFERIYEGYEMPVFEAVGYLNTHWVNVYGETVTADALQAIKEGGVHLYAAWRPIEYTVEYVFRDFTVQGNTDVWNYDTVSAMKTPDNFPESIVRKGYRFAGWTDNKGASIYSEAVKYRPGEEYSRLASTDGATVTLYDLWEPINYRISYAKFNSDMVPLAETEVTYGKGFTLPKADCPGYSFSHWKTADGDILYAGDNTKDISYTDGEEIMLTPVFNEISYTVVLDFSGGRAPTQPDLISGSKITVKYTEQYKLPALTKEGQTAYNWVCSDNGKSYGAGDTLYMEFVSECTVTLKVVWTAASYTVHYDFNGGISGDDTDSRSWSDGKALRIPERLGYDFSYWTNPANGRKYTPNTSAWTGNLIDSVDDNGKTVELVAVWTPIVFIITFDSNGGATCSPIQVKFDDIYGPLPEPTRTGYSFAGWYNAEGKRITANSIMDTVQTANHKLTARWSPNKYTVSFNSDGGSACESKVVYFGEKYGTLPTPTRGNVYVENGYTTYTFQRWEYNGATVNSSTTVTVAGNHTLKAIWTSSYVDTTPPPSDTSCLVKGTLIMLPDGSYTEIENLKIGDMVMTFDHATGEYVAAPIAFRFYAYNEIKVITLTFDGGIEIKLANGGHGLFDSTLGKYVLVTPDNADEFIGHRFSYAMFDGETGNTSEIELKSAVITTEYVERYDIATANQFNHIANGVLACSDTIVELCNVFEFNGDGTWNSEKMNADIEKYGLFTYEEWSEYVTYEEFTVFNGGYFKIAIAKGLMTEAELYALIEDIHTSWE